MSCDGTLIEAPPAQHNNNNNNSNSNNNNNIIIAEPRTPLQPKIVHTQVSGGLGSTTLNPEASVFHLPAARQHTPPATPSQPNTHINGFTHHVYPFMNGDVGKQYCGVCPPTPDTPGSLAVDAAPLESASLTSSITSTPLNSSAKSLVASSSVFTTPPSDMASSSSPVSRNDPPQDSSKEVLLTAEPILTCQQNGELELETADLSTNTSVTSIPDDSNPLNTTTEIDVVTVDDEVDSGVAATDVSLPTEAPSSTETAPATPQTESSVLEASESKPALKDATEETPLRTVVTECDGGDSQVDAAGKGEEVGEANNETQGTQTTPAQSPAPNQPAPEPLTRDQIKALVAQQVEFFFSRENLSNDPYLISQMDSDQYVPVFILAGCSQFKSITKDHSIIVEALKESPFVQLDEEKNRVRPNYKRCIVILREIPESTPVEEIEAMFKGEECPKLVSCEFVHNSSWYVTFESDEDAQKAYWYLRGVVKTFKDKPILARIKTKPISRLGCLSVLPSYGGKGPGDSKDQPAPPSTPGPGGSQGGPPAPTPQPGTPATPAPPTSSYNPRAPTPYMYPAPPSSVNGPTYPYSYPPATNTMPTAYFYPNMPVWTAPGGFYDINSFLQFNGLSPQAAFKPPPTPHNQGRFNGRRNSKHGRQNDNRQPQNNGGYNGTSGGHSGYHHNQRSHSHSGHSRPQSAQSPSAGPQGHQVHRSGNNSQTAAVSHPQPTATVATTTTTTTTAASVPQQTPSPAVSNIPANNHNFAQCDLALASQSNLYTSFSPPMGAAAAAAAPNSSIRTDKKDMVSVKATPMSNSSSNSSNVSSTSSTPPVSTSGPASHTNTNASPTASSSPMLNTPAVVAAAAASIAGAAPSLSQTVVTAAMPPTQISSQIPPSQHQLQHQQQLQQQQQYPAGPPPPPPPHHRNAYNSEYHHHPGPHPPHYHHPMQRDHPRQFYHNWGYPRSRGGGRGRRRPREEEEMMGMGPGGRGRGGQGPRGPPTQPPGTTDMTNKSLPQQPDLIASPQNHFDLEAAAFPPLPGASPEEPVAPVAEERPAEPLPSAWGSSDSQRFSDVMKGTAKPRVQSQPSQTSSPGEPIIEIPSPTNQITQLTTSGFSHVAATTCPVIQAASPPTTLAAVATPTQATAPTAAAIVATAAPTAAAIVATPPPPPPPTAAAIVATPPTSQSNTENTNSISQESTFSSAAHTPPQQTAVSISSSSSSSINNNVNSSNTSVNNGVNKLDSRYSQRSVYSRDERRGGAVGGLRGDRREYPRDNIRGPRDYRNIRENNSRGTGKENRPQPSRPWKEDRVDADGWITKGSRAQRETNRDQQQQSMPPQYNQRDKVESREARSSHLVNGDTTPPPSPKPQVVEKTSKDDAPATEDQKVSTSQPLNNNDGEHKPSWAMMAKLSKEPMERLSSELKEKEEQEKIKKLRLNTRPQMKPQENYIQREGKPLRRDGPQRENRQSSERGGGTFRPRDSARPKSPK
ncbi:unnamed protein product [Meganyctiphanes norvegica]|uniref:HTH La-type RNA-binding domain-containing protein n=1 Tax=Meganyctiphanes norvegica TaxID=48144 RepID=A0AAV2R666_MEGNR